LFDGVGGILFLGLWIFCIVDVITTPPDQVRNLPKIVWVILVVLLVDIGSIAWLVAGRRWGADAGSPISRMRSRAGQDGAAAADPAVGRPTARLRPANPDDDEEFLATLRARAEEQRRRAREAERGPDDAPPSVT
jgi:hypothetical protein